MIEMAWGRTKMGEEEAKRGRRLGSFWQVTVEGDMARFGRVWHCLAGFGARGWLRFVRVGALR